MSENEDSTRHASFWPADDMPDLLAMFDSGAGQVDDPALGSAQAPDVGRSDEIGRASKRRKGKTAAQEESEVWLCSAALLALPVRGRVPRSSAFPIV